MSASLYLQKLNLRNFATFENQEIFFHERFNGIVGETGSGKSLILDAFQLLLGSRADKKLVRKDSDCAVIEGSFKVLSPSLSSFFDNLGFPLEDEQTVIVKRIIYKTGKSKSFLNHMSCSLSTLSHFSKTFVDLVGQFENQKLSNSEYQLKLLDQFAKTEPLLTKYQSKYKSYQELLNEVKSLEIQVTDKRQREDYLRFQIQELSDLDPSKEREEKLIQLKHKLLNAEALSESLENLKLICSEGDDNILSGLKQAQKIANSAHGLLSNELMSQLEESISLFEDFSFSLSSQSLEKEEDTNIDEVLEELDKYQKLKRKFNCESDKLEEIKESIENELLSISSLDKDLENKRNHLNIWEKELHKIASELHKVRSNKKLELEKSITQALSALNMEGSTFKVQLDKCDILNEYGLSKAYFLAETNKGEGFFKIKEIASGGELSRILLCLRQIVASDDTINIFFFDEIDTGIGGETAQKIAAALKKVSQNGQVLAITHLPQIAKKVDEIIFVAKKSYEVDKKLRTISYVENKKGKEREEVISTLAGL